MVKFALFGAGLIGSIHASNITAHPRATLRYVYDVNRAASEQAASRFGAQVASSAEEIWAAHDVDAVLIASSTNTHAALLSSAIKTNKLVYCEKPIDVDMERVKTVVQEASHVDVPIMIGFSRRFDANHLGVREAIQRGAIGKVEMMHLTSRDQEPPPISYVNVSGGQFRDQTIHFFDLACWLADEAPLEIYVAGSVLVASAIGQAEQRLGLAGDSAEAQAKRACTEIRLDSAWGSDRVITWLLARGYQITANSSRPSGCASSSRRSGGGRRLPALAARWPWSRGGSRLTARWPSTRCGRRQRRRRAAIITRSSSPASSSGPCRRSSPAMMVGLAWKPI